MRTNERKRKQSATAINNSARRLTYLESTTTTPGGRRVGTAAIDPLPLLVVKIPLSSHAQIKFVGRSITITSHSSEALSLFLITSKRFLLPPDDHLSFPA